MPSLRSSPWIRGAPIGIGKAHVTDQLAYFERHLCPAERQRLDFHLRQFVDAMSPTLLLVSNPGALLSGSILA